MWADVLTSTVSSAATAGMGIMVYVYQKLHARLDHIEDQGIKNKISVEKKLDKVAVREVVEDKLAPIHVMLETIQDDVKEIKTDIKSRL